jgi:hypothetical protein
LFHVSAHAFERLLTQLYMCRRVGQASDEHRL